jgi:hypothetical protein
MATNKPKVQGYIDPQIFDRYTQFKNEHGITKDSEALNKILASFLGFDSTPKTDLVSRIEFETAIANLRSEFLGNKPETKIESSIASEDTKISPENIPFPRATSTDFEDAILLILWGSKNKKPRDEIVQYLKENNYSASNCSYGYRWSRKMVQDFINKSTTYLK